MHVTFNDDKQLFTDIATIWIQLSRVVLDVTGDVGDTRRYT